MAEKKPILLYLTSGHRQMVLGGGRDPGAVSGSCIESEIALNACRGLRGYLINERGDR